MHAPDHDTTSHGPYLYIKLLTKREPGPRFKPAAQHPADCTGLVAPRQVELQIVQGFGLSGQHYNGGWPFCSREMNNGGSRLEETGVEPRGGGEGRF